MLSIDSYLLVLSVLIVKFDFIHTFPSTIQPSYLLTHDTDIVGSIIREVRAIPPAAVTKNYGSQDKTDLESAGSDPDNFEHHWDSGDKGVTGYIKRSQDKGSDGYNHYDSFHKKDGDNYDFEHHTAYGQEKGDKDKDKEGSEHHSSYQEAKENNDKDGDEDTTDADKTEHDVTVDDAGDEDTKGKKTGDSKNHSYQVLENITEDKSEDDRTDNDDVEDEEISESFIEEALKFFEPEEKEDNEKPSATLNQYRDSKDAEDDLGLANNPDSKEDEAESDEDDDEGEEESASNKKEKEDDSNVYSFYDGDDSKKADDADNDDDDY